MERRVLIAALLTALFLSFYGQLLARWAPPSNRVAKATTRQVPGSTSTPSPTSESVQAILQPIPGEDVIRISSDDLELAIGRGSATITEVVLKRFRDQESDGPVRIGGQAALLGLFSKAGPVTWRVAEEHESAVRLVSDQTNGGAYELTYSLDQEKPLLRMALNRRGAASADLLLVSSWAKTEEGKSRYNLLEYTVATRVSDGKHKYKRFREQGPQEETVPRGTVQLTLCEHYFCQSIRNEDLQGAGQLIRGHARVTMFSLPIDGQHWQNGSYEATVYLGPKDFFHRKAAGFEQALPMGMMEQIGLMLLVLLKGLAKLTGSYGIAIILFGILVTCLMAPFTVMSFRSMKKMAALRPQVERLMAEHKNDPKRANQEMFSLYRQHRVSPVGGCLPMLLQFPILIALFSAIPNFIDLRGQPFLWIADLSGPDRLALLPMTLPIIGNALNLLPILMAGAMYLQMKLSQRQMPSDQSNPLAKAMSGPMMSVVFGVMFYHSPSGLMLYWLTNSLISATWYQLAK